jgi:hexosaminidase
MPGAPAGGRHPTGAAGGTAQARRASADSAAFARCRLTTLRQGMKRPSTPARFALALASLAAVPATAQRASEPALVPRPAQLELRDGVFALRDVHPLAVEPDDAALRDIAALLAERVARTCGRRLEFAGAVADGAVVLRRRGARGAGRREAYRLDLRRDRLRVDAAHDDGLRQGASTALQLLCTPGARSVPALRIDDAPSLAWRGAMLDSARHYQSPEFIRRFLDAMALHKLNVLHWHLTDDQAWRLEIRKYPRLTEVGAWRVPAGAAAQADIDPATGTPRRYGGWYDQRTVRELVAYAARLGITVVPEIEMPGHASAAIAAYPRLGAKRGAVSTVPSDWGVYPNAFALDDETFAFLSDVLREAMALFPSPWIHVGGDEVESGQWLASEEGRRLLRTLGSDDPKALQPWFTQRIGRFLEAHGRRLVGWDEILAPGVPRDAVVMSWRGTDGAVRAARAGHDAILSPWPTLYFDNRQVDDADEPPGRLAVVALEHVYRFEPIPPSLDAGERRHILGVQGNLWTEHIRTEARVWHMGFPRLAAVAEIGWTPAARRDWTDFLRRLAPQYAHYAALGIEASDAAIAGKAASEPVGGA